VQEAGRSDDQRYRTVLREIAVKWSHEEVYYKVAFDALHSLWLLGEPRKFFLENVRKEKEHKWLTYYSIHVLSYDIDEDTLQALERMGTEASDEHVKGNLRYAKHVLYLRGELAKQRNARAKAAFLVQYCGAGFTALSGWTIEENEPTSSLTQEAVWARIEMARLLLQDRRAVQAAIDSVEFDRVFSIDFTLRYREYIRQTVAEAAYFLAQEQRRQAGAVQQAPRSKK